MMAKGVTSAIARDVVESVLAPGLTLERQLSKVRPFIPIGETRLTKAEFAAGLIGDASGLNKGLPSQLVHPDSEADIIAAYAHARAGGTNVVMSGARHSMGGQNVVDGAVHLDMRGFNRMAFDARSGSLHVQPGATWAEIQRYLDPMGLSPKVQQSSNIFTVGGSIGADIHGRDVRFGPIADTVRSIALIKPTGERVIARADDPATRDLFRATMGGYGLTGTISEVELDVVANEALRRSTHNIKTRDFAGWYAANMEGNPNARFMQARVAPHNLDTMHVITFDADPAAKAIKPLVHKKPGLLAPLLGLPYKATMKSKLAKRLAWIGYRYGDNNLVGRMFAKTSRNQTMSVSLEFLRGKSTTMFGNPAKHTQVLQEYFVPASKIGDFLTDFKGVIKAHDANVLTITVRKVPADANAMLTVSPEETFAVMTYMDQKLKPGAQAAWDAYAQAADATVVKHGGRPYIAYRNVATADQLAAGYPQVGAFMDVVRAADPEGIVWHPLKDSLARAAESAGRVQPPGV